MPIIMIENRYPLCKNQEVIAAWLEAMEKYPRPEDLFTPLLETAVSSRKKGLRVLSAYQPNPGKFEEALAYFGRFMSTFHHIQSYSYEMSTWMTIDEAMASIGQKAPER